MIGTARPGVLDLERREHPVRRLDRVQGQSAAVPQRANKTSGVDPGRRIRWVAGQDDDGLDRAGGEQLGHGQHTDQVVLPGEPGHPPRRAVMMLLSGLERGADLSQQVLGGPHIG